MQFTISLTSAITAFALGSGAYLLYKYKLSANNEKEGTKLLKIPPSKVIFFTGFNANCRKYCLTKRRKEPCGQDCSLNKLNYMVSLLDKAERTLDICIYLITCKELSYAIIRAFKRGVKVRIIVDEDMSTCSESKSRWFVDAGIPVKSKKTNSLMHHKFCIIDYAISTRKLLTGSLNWTLQGLAGNYEYVTIISHPVPVLEYQKEFNCLWKDFSIKN